MTSNTQDICNQIAASTEDVRRYVEGLGEDIEKLRETVNDLGETVDDLKHAIDLGRRELLSVTEFSNKHPWLTLTTQWLWVALLVFGILRLLR